ncbi:hypothetical protein ET495_11260 [Xylanimonas allomyrinae]|uniref:Uncharacterized protein n=1 Tax=Xylanimonas allomyrinae TaxID=2509459 RepID=A0A4P6F080_9MICO|nr:hypothetical protein [Xylanimonas allomyrinae]QAY63728.1 hypothetical protein ET495_11260 [Xylanimonas allomyrinae]
MSALTFAVGDRVVSTSPYSVGRIGTVRGIEVHPARFDDDGALSLPKRTVVSVTMDSGDHLAFVADGDQALQLIALDPLPAPLCPPWCDRTHGGFDATTSHGDIAVEHAARRGDATVGAMEFLEPNGAREMTTLAFDGLNSSDDFVASTPAELAADLRGYIADLTALVNVLDGGAS